MSGRVELDGLPHRAKARATLLLVMGMLAGGCLAVAAGCGILVSGRRLSPVPEATTSLFISTRMATPTLTPVGEVPEILLSAEELLQRGEPQAAIDLLSSSLNHLTRLDRARACELLGHAEFQLGHSSLAGSRFECAYELEPTAERLFEAALAHDFGGELRLALDRYRELAAWEGKEADPYRDFAGARFDQLRVILGTPSP